MTSIQFSVVPTADGRLDGTAGACFFTFFVFLGLGVLVTVVDGVNVAVGVNVGVLVAVGVFVGVEVGVGVAVAVGVNVAVKVGDALAIET